MSLLTSDESVPIDVVHKATCEIRKEYYPYAEFGIKCTAFWSAISVWEHEEEYQVAREETVFIDYEGKEHKEGGRDSETVVSNGGHMRTVYHDRTPLSRTVYETKTKTVEDGRQATQDNVALKLVERVERSEMPPLDWAKHFKRDQFVDASSDYLDQFNLMPETITTDDAKHFADMMAYSDTENYASKQVPGDRYENFNLQDFEIVDMKRTDAFLGVYHIIYQYDGESYECYLSGGNDESDYLLGPTPIDESIKSQLDTLDEAMSKNDGCKRTFFLLGGYMDNALRSRRSVLQWS